MKPHLEKQRPDEHLTYLSLCPQTSSICSTEKITHVFSFTSFHFSMIIDIQYYFMLVSAVQYSGKTVIEFRKWSRTCFLNKGKDECPQSQDSQEIMGSTLSKLPYDTDDYEPFYPQQDIKEHFSVTFQPQNLLCFLHPAHPALKCQGLEESKLGI